jgi:hypothetical protein
MIAGIGSASAWDSADASSAIAMKQLSDPPRLEIFVDMPAAILAKQACQCNYIVQGGCLEADHKSFSTRVNCAAWPLAAG